MALQNLMGALSNLLFTAPELEFSPPKEQGYQPVFLAAFEALRKNFNETQEDTTMDTLREKLADNTEKKLCLADLKLSKSFMELNDTPNPQMVEPFFF